MPPIAVLASLPVTAPILVNAVCPFCKFVTTDFAWDDTLPTKVSKLLAPFLPLNADFGIDCFTDLPALTRVLTIVSAPGLRTPPDDNCDGVCAKLPIAAVATPAALVTMSVPLETAPPRLFDIAAAVAIPPSTDVVAFLSIAPLIAPTSGTDADVAGVTPGAMPPAFPASEATVLTAEISASGVAGNASSAPDSTVTSTPWLAYCHGM